MKRDGSFIACNPCWLLLQVVSFYVEQSRANNHSVREAACACMAEMMAKVRAYRHGTPLYHQMHYILSMSSCEGMAEMMAKMPVY